MEELHCDQRLPVKSEGVRGAIRTGETVDNFLTDGVAYSRC